MRNSLSDEDKNSGEQSENAKNGDRAQPKETVDPKGNEKDRQKQHSEVFCEIHRDMMTLPPADARTISRRNSILAIDSIAAISIKSVGKAELKLNTHRGLGHSVISKTQSWTDA